MKRLIAGTIILIAAVVAITVIYFKNINAPAGHTTQVMKTIPNTAALIFEFDNDNGFYDMFAGNTLFDNICGKNKVDELTALRQRLLQNFALKAFFEQQHIYLSIHPQQGEQVNLLMTVAAREGFKESMLDELPKQYKNGLQVTTFTASGKKVYDINVFDVKEHFYLVSLGDRILSGSFSKELALQCAAYKPVKDQQAFMAIPDQQNNNSLANLYINYAQLTPLFDQLFKTPNYGLFKSFRMMPALAALTMSYKTDALMFNGYTNIQNNRPESYLTIFRDQKPIENKLNEVFPSTTAYCTSFALSDPQRFSADLSAYHTKAKLDQEKTALFEKVRAETGRQIKGEFNKLLGNEFAVVITRFDEKFAIIKIKDGLQLRPLMVNVSNMVNDDVGQFKYDKLPFFLLGDTFSLFTHPYFLILDNYLILANSTGELDSYKDYYQNQKLLSKSPAYNQFDGFVSERSNVAFFLNFRNIFPTLKRDLKPGFVDDVAADRGWGKFYGLSYQLSASERNFYTNFYMRLNDADTTGTVQ